MTQAPTHLCGGRRILIFGVTVNGWTWSCNWPGVRLGRPCQHTQEVLDKMRTRKVTYRSNVPTVWESVTEDMRVFSYNEPCPGVWLEAGISDCEFGCKIYRNPHTEERVLMHNSNYGCHR